MTKIIRRGREEGEPIVLPPSLKTIPENGGDPVSAPVQLPLEGVRPGDCGLRVSVIQLRLGIPVTGNFDDTTRQAVARSQADLGLEVHGVACPIFHHKMGLPWPPLNS